MVASSVTSTALRLPAAPAAEGAAARPPPSFDAELSKCESQLADWTHCVSAKTPDGKAKIAEISAKIADIKNQMQKAEQARPKKPSLLTQAAAPEAIARRATPLNGLGGHIDLYA